MYRVGISGSYGGLNLGDEAILEGIIGQLRQSVPVDITVFSRCAEDTLARHDVNRALDARQLSRDEIVPEVEGLDLLILGGGGILYDAEAAVYLREVTLAQERGIPVLVYAVSAGPLHDARAQDLVRTALTRAAAVTVRERQALRVLEELGIQRSISLAADPALLIKPRPLAADALKREGLDDRHRLVGMSIREPGPAAPDIDERHYTGLIANAADYIVDRLDADIVFVPLERRNRDMQHAHAVIAQMADAQRATVLKGEYTAGELLTIMGHFSFAVGMRLHFMIFAALQRVPFVALPYAGKTTGFVEDLGMTAPSVQQVHAGRLIAHIDRSWDLRRDLQARIDSALPRLQERARETNAIAVRLLIEREQRQATSQPEVA